MNADKKIEEHWLQLMQEMVLLPVEDERRRAFEANVAQAGDAAKQEWLIHVCEEEQLRLELLDVSLPPRLNERLLTIPAEARNESPSMQKWMLVGSAAVVLVIVGLVGWKVWDHSVFIHNLHTLAWLAMSDHMDDAHLDVETQDKTLLETALRDQLPFEISLPDLGDKYTLVGGRRCVLGTHPVLFSRWRDSAGEYTLFQFQPSDFSLHTPLKQTLVQIKSPTTDKHPCDVLVWVRENRGYALVADHGMMLNDLTIQ